MHGEYTLNFYRFRNGVYPLQQQLTKGEIMSINKGFGRRRITRYWLRPLSLMMSIALLSVSGLAASTSAQAATSKSKNLTPLQKGLAYFNGKTVSLLVGGAGGTNYDVKTRALAIELSKYLHATMNVEDISAGGGVTEMDQLAHATPNGLTMGMFSLGAIFYDKLLNIPSINFNVAKEDFLGIQGADPQLLLTTPASPYQTISALQSASAPVPTGMYSSHTATESILLSRVFGIKEHYVFGYSSANLQLAGFLRGDSDLLVDGPSAVQSAVLAGQAKVIGVLNTGSMNVMPSAPSWVKSAPTLSTLEKKYALKTSQAQKAEALLNLVIDVPNAVYGVQANTPSYILTTWQKALQWAQTTPYALNIELNQGDFGPVVPPGLIKKDFQTEVAQFAAIKQLGGF
jgi:tripartite-type tricarboxylate transporter receptor subunit TctC